MRFLIVALLLALLPSLGACRSHQAIDDDGLVWTRPKSSPLLEDGAYLRGSYIRNMLPTIVQWYVFADGKRLETIEELRAHLRPIDTEDEALAYRTLLADVYLGGQQAGHAMGAPLIFRPEGRRDNQAEYDAEDAARWGIRAGTETRRVRDVFLVRRPHYVVRDEPGPVPKNVIRGWTTKVEHVEERIHVDGRYERVVLRVLEDGDGPAGPYAPMPIW